jgi:hypothetical protein
VTQQNNRKRKVLRIICDQWQEGPDFCPEGYGVCKAAVTTCPVFRAIHWPGMETPEQSCCHHPNVVQIRNTEIRVRKIT